MVSREKTEKYPGDNDSADDITGINMDVAVKFGIAGVVGNTERNGQTPVQKPHPGRPDFDLFFHGYLLIHTDRYDPAYALCVKEFVFLEYASIFMPRCIACGLMSGSKDKARKCGLCFPSSAFFKDQRQLLSPTYPITHGRRGTGMAGSGWRWER